MSTLADMTLEAATQLRERVAEVLEGCTSVEQAAQRLVRTVCDEHRDEIPLARVYVTIPSRQLPPDVLAFAERIAASVPAAVIADSTPVLTLLGTHGQVPAWCDRHTSEGHVGIPLLSAEFIRGVPMIASLLEQFGVDLAAPPRDAIAGLCRRTTPFSGAFYVEDARTLEDDLGRKVIPAQDFVAEHGIVSVIGSGAIHVTTRQLVVLILFARCHVLEPEASFWWSLASHFVAKTSKLFQNGALFAGA